MMDNTIEIGIVQHENGTFSVYSGVPKPMSIDSRFPVIKIFSNRFKGFVIPEYDPDFRQRLKEPPS